MQFSTTYNSTSNTLPWRSKIVFVHTVSVPFSASTFTGKELDEETGYGYFGARYYDPTLMTGWTAVDPMADKYPNISPYAYCAWNPMKLVDPDGKEVYIAGSQAEEAVECLQTAKMQVSRDSETGKLSVTFRGGHQLENLSDEEKMIFDAISCTDITINVQAERASTEYEDKNSIKGRDGFRYETYGGAFLGTEYSEEGGGHANTYCRINLELMDFYGNNQLVPHEVSEQFLLGKKTLEGRSGIPLARSDQENPEYNECHKLAIPQSNYKLHLGGKIYFGSTSIWGKKE